MTGAAAPTASVAAKSPHIYTSIKNSVNSARRSAVAPLAADNPTHLLSRFTFGASPADRAYIDTHGMDAWWANQKSIGLAHPGYSALPGLAAKFPYLAMSAPQVDAALTKAGRKYGWDALDAVSDVTMGLRVWSPAQLYETVVDFFADHLNVPIHNGDVWNTRHTFDRDVIRKHAFGTFSDMLVASARNPAMLYFLNNAESDKSAVNENYGRELLELHTVGLHYTESDVRNSAKILTGRTVQWDTGVFKYDPQMHWVGPIKVLGFQSANAGAATGLAAGDSYLRYLAAHPLTAQHLARKLCVRFVSDNPSSALVAAVAAVYAANRTAILPTIEAIVHSHEFWESRGAKVRRPSENLFATMRVLGVKPTDYATATNSLSWMTQTTGNRPIDWLPPNGYPDVAAAWRSSGTLLRLWEFHRGLSQNWYDGFAKRSNVELYASAKPVTSGAAIKALTQRLTHTTWPANHLAALQTFLGEPASTPLASSSLRWYLDHLVPLILDSAYHALR